MENKKAFLLYLDYEDNLKELTDEELGQLLRAIFKYERTREEPQNLGLLVKVAFGFIKGNLNRDREKYDKLLIVEQWERKSGQDLRSFLSI